MEEIRLLTFERTLMEIGAPVAGAGVSTSGCTATSRGACSRGVTGGMPEAAGGGGVGRMTHYILCLAPRLSHCCKASEYVEPQTPENTWASGPTSDNNHYEVKVSVPIPLLRGREEWNRPARSCVYRGRDVTRRYWRA